MRDERAFEEFVEARAPSLLRHAHLLCGDPDRAVELVEQGLAAAYRRWPELGLARSELIARRAILAALLARHRRPRPRLSRPPADAADVAGVVWRALDGLPVRRRVVLVLRYADRLDDAGIADLVGVRSETVASEAAAGLAALARILRGRGEPADLLPAALADRADPAGASTDGADPARGVGAEPAEPSYGVGGGPGAGSSRGVGGAPALPVRVALVDVLARVRRSRRRRLVVRAGWAALVVVAAVLAVAVPATVGAGRAGPADAAPPTAPAAEAGRSGLFGWAGRGSLVGDQQLLRAALAAWQADVPAAQRPASAVSVLYAGEVGAGRLVLLQGVDAGGRARVAEVTGAAGATGLRVIRTDPLVPRIPVLAIPVLTAPSAGLTSPDAAAAGGGAANPGPAATGPAVTGSASTGPAVTGSASTGPAVTGSASTGPASTGPASTGPASTGPAAAVPAAAVPAAAGSPGRLRLLGPPVDGAALYVREGGQPASAPLRRLGQDGTGLSEPFDSPGETYVVVLGDAASLPATTPATPSPSGLPPSAGAAAPAGDTAPAAAGSGVVSTARLTAFPDVLEYAVPTLAVAGPAVPNYGWYADGRLLAELLHRPVRVAALGPDHRWRPRSGPARGHEFRSQGYEVTSAGRRLLSVVFRLDGRVLCADLSPLGPADAAPRIPLAVHRCVAPRYGAGVVQLLAPPGTAAVTLTLATKGPGQRRYQRTFRAPAGTSGSAGFVVADLIAAGFPTDRGRAQASTAAGTLVGRALLGPYRR